MGTDMCHSFLINFECCSQVSRRDYVTQLDLLTCDSSGSGGGLGSVEDFPDFGPKALGCGSSNNTSGNYTGLVLLCLHCCLHMRAVSLYILIDDVITHLIES